MPCLQFEALGEYTALYCIAGEVGVEVGVGTDDYGSASRNAVTPSYHVLWERKLCLAVSMLKLSPDDSRHGLPHTSILISDTSDGNG